MPFSAETSWERMRQLTAFPPHLEDYYKGILAEYESTFNTAEKAKAKGLDPNEFVESKVVFDLADRVNQMLGLTQFEGLADRLRELLKSTTKERATLTIAEEIALGKFGPMKIEQALDHAVRAGLAVITDGVTVAPIQGIYSVSIKKNDDNSDYASISYAGPMRSAGGTEAALSVLIGDVVSEEARPLPVPGARRGDWTIHRGASSVRTRGRQLPVPGHRRRRPRGDIEPPSRNRRRRDRPGRGRRTPEPEEGEHRQGQGRSPQGPQRRDNRTAHKLTKVLRELEISGWEWLPQLKGGKQESTNETEKAGAHFEEVISGRAVLSSHNAQGRLQDQDTAGPSTPGCPRWASTPCLPRSWTTPWSPDPGQGRHARQSPRPSRSSTQSRARPS